MYDGYWNRLKAEWCRKAMKLSTFPPAALSVMLPKMEDSKTVLDVGAGCGPLSIPLAKAGKKVSALDPSPAMINALEEEIKDKGLTGIKTISAEWEEAGLKPHDSIIFSNMPELTANPGRFLDKALPLFKKTIFIIEDAGDADELYFGELYPLLFGRAYEKRPDYLKTYTALHETGTCANVDIIGYESSQPFADMNEAVEFWKEYIGIVTEEHDRKLKEFLEGKLVKKGGRLFSKVKKRSAVMWWKK